MYEVIVQNQKPFLKEGYYGKEVIPDPLVIIAHQYQWTNTQSPPILHLIDENSTIIHTIRPAADDRVHIKLIQKQDS